MAKPTTRAQALDLLDKTEKAIKNYNKFVVDKGLPSLDGCQVLHNVKGIKSTKNKEYEDGKLTGAAIENYLSPEKEKLNQLRPKLEDLVNKDIINKIKIDELLQSKNKWIRYLT